MSEALNAARGEPRTITAFFEDREDAQDAVERLIDAELPRESIRLVEGAQSQVAGASDDDSNTHGGIWEALKDMFLPDEDRHVYAEGLHRGGYLVAVTVADAYYERALDILDDEGTIDINARETEWRADGWTGYQGAGAAFAPGAGLAQQVGGASRGAGTGTGSEQVIPVVEEELRVGKREVSHGRVRVRSYVVETPVSEDVTLRNERVNVERRAADRPMAAGEQAFQERTVELEQKGEEAVVSKDARVTEEVVVSRDVSDYTEKVSDTVRRTEVEVDDERKTKTRDSNRDTIARR